MLLLIPGSQWVAWKCLLLVSVGLVLKDVATERPGSRIRGCASEQEAPLASSISRSPVPQACVTVSVTLLLQDYP